MEITVEGQHRDAILPGYTAPSHGWSTGKSQWPRVVCMREAQSTEDNKGGWRGK